jgi:hypothetical protein
MTTLGDYKTYAIHRTMGLCLSLKVVNSDHKRLATYVPMLAQG